MPTKAKQRVMCLIQCGETAWDHDERLHGQTDLPLTNSGRATLVTIAKRTPAGAVGTVFHPPDEAATDTADIYASAWKAKRRVIEELADPDLGLLEGLTRQALGERYPKRARAWAEDPLSLTPPEGEPVIEARMRIFNAMARAIRRPKAIESAFVLHGIALGLLRCFMANQPSGRLWTLNTERPPVERYLVTEALIERLQIEESVTSG
jgi:broad specificity phosphatase PhoE